MNAETLIASARYQALKVAPYFRPILARMTFLEAPKDSGLTTMATSKHGVCLYDPAFVEALRAQPKALAFVLLHEASHLWMRHHARIGSRDHALSNCAQDIAINPAILSMGLELPVLDGKKAGLLPEQYKLPANLAWEEYYNLLEEKAEQNAQGKPQPQGKGGNQGDGQGHGSQAQAPANGPPQDGPGSGPQVPGNGSCGSCSHGHAQGDAQGTQGDESTQDGARSDADMARAAKSVSEQMVKARGHVPAGWKREAEDHLKPSVVPWQTKLRAAVTQATSITTMGAAVSVFDRLSRRQWGVGFGPGKPILPRMRTPEPRIAVIIDTSGSMSRADLNAALSELKAILKLGKVTYMTCDAQVHTNETIRTVKQAMRNLKGGGGSNFIPAFEALAKDPPHVAVFLTDCDISVPSKAPAYKVIWGCITHSPDYAPAQWGERVHIPPT